MDRFINRKKEMEFLEKEYKKNESSLIVIYGRRRIGKTSLIKEFQKNKDSIYFLATEEAEKQNRDMLKNIIADNLNDKEMLNINFDTWESLFNYLINNKVKGKKVLVIDEFQYLGKINQAFPSIFQRIWDEILKNKNIMVILCGSLINMMETQTLNYTSPLYGRRSGQIKLKQINFEYYKDFFNKNIDNKSLIEKYAVTGGVPKYIEVFNDNKNIYEQIEEKVLSSQSFLYEEPYFLLQNEVSEVGSYFSIIKTIAQGNRKLSKISTALEVPQTSLSKYLQTLINLDILEREVPITEENPQKSKKGQYKIKDNFISFWFQFIYPNKGFLEMGDNKIVINKIKNNFIDNHVSFVYEDICREKMWKLNGTNKLKMTFDKLGRWWNNEEEIDIVGFDSIGNDIIFGECKYTKKTMDVDVLYSLIEKAKKVEWKKDDRKEKYILFSINGYTDKLKELAKTNKDVILAEN